MKWLYVLDICVHWTWCSLQDWGVAERLLHFLKASAEVAAFKKVVEHRKFITSRNKDQAHIDFTPFCVFK